MFVNLMLLKEFNFMFKQLRLKMSNSVSGFVITSKLINILYNNLWSVRKLYLTTIINTKVRFAENFKKEYL